MSARAGIVVTGTEVLTGRTVDRNGPWMSDRLARLGVEHAHTLVVGDRPDDVRSALRFFADEGMDVVVTSGGLGPTEDDLTAAVVAEFQGRPLALDEGLEERIWQILLPLRERFPDIDLDSVRASNRKQAMVPRGATILEPVGTAPGLVVPAADGRDGPTVLVLPGPPRELQPMWERAVETEAFRAAIAGAEDFSFETMRLFGIPESEIARTMRAARDGGVDLDALEITTCLKRGEVEVVTRWRTGEQDDLYRAFEAVVADAHPDTLFSRDGATVDEQVSSLLVERGWRIAVAESCTGGLLGGRLTERPGSSAWFAGGLIVYANEAKRDLAGVPQPVLDEHGAVSAETAQLLATAALERLGADVGVAITGIAGPDGGTDEKPVGTVWFSAVDRTGARITRDVRLPGARFDVRDRSTTVALHLVRRLLLGQRDEG